MAINQRSCFLFNLYIFAVDFFFLSVCKYNPKFKTLNYYYKCKNQLINLSLLAKTTTQLKFFEYSKIYIYGIY